MFPHMMPCAPLPQASKCSFVDSAALLADLQSDTPDFTMPAKLLASKVFVRQSLVNPFDRMIVEQDQLARAAERQRKIDNHVSQAKTREMFGAQVCVCVYQGGRGFVRSFMTPQGDRKDAIQRQVGHDPQWDRKDAIQPPLRMSMLGFCPG